MNDSRLLRLALWYAKQGWHIFPLAPGTKIPPQGSRGFYEASTDTQQITRWFTRTPDANVALRCGAESGVIVVDIDLYKPGTDVALEALEACHGAFPSTVESVTPHGGQQLFYAHPGVRIPPSTSKLGTGIDIRGDGSYVVLPPSRLSDAESPYLWESSSRPDLMPLTPCPPWLVSLLTAPTPRAAPMVAGQIRDGQRNATLTSLAGSMRRRGMHESAIVAALIEENRACVPPLDEAEVRKIAASVARYTPPAAPAASGLGSWPAVPYGDEFYAQCLVQLYGDRIRYAKAAGGWFLWDGRHWRQDEAEGIVRLMVRTLEAVGADALSRHEEALMKHVSRSFSHRAIMGALAQACSIETVVRAPDAFDRDPWLLNCRNGTLDLRSGTLRPHDQDELITRCLSIPYHADAQAPTWQAFLWRVMGGPMPDEDGPEAALLERHERAERLVRFLQRAVGYALTGRTNEDCLFVLYGTGRNGKSKFLDACHALLGPYAKTAQMQSFLHQDRETVRNDLADLRGVRMVSAIELSNGQRLSEGLVKQLTGGDRVKARFLFREYFEFLPNFKLFLAFNHKPEVRGSDVAIWERIKTVPFDVFIPPCERDVDLADKLKAELPGILAWAVEGCLAWQQEGLAPPPEVEHATAAYRAEMDRIGAFIAECCIVSSSVSCRATDLYQHYVEWCAECGEPPVTQTAFGRDTSNRGFKSEKRGKPIWKLGIAISKQE